MNVEFERVAPYLKEPLVLIGFFLLIAFSLSRYLVKRVTSRPLQKEHSYRILRLILLCGFILGLLIIIFGFALKHQELVNQQRAAESLRSMLSNLLNKAGETEEKKNEIVEQVLIDFRRGILSKEQIEEEVTKIKNSSAPSINNLLNREQFRNQPQLNNPSIPAKTRSPLLLASTNTIQPQPEINRFTEVETRAQNQPVASPSKEIYSLPTGEVKNHGLLLTPPISLFPLCPFDLISSELDITSPKSEAKVHHDALVRGTAKITVGGYLWVLAHKEGVEGWWPQGGGDAKIRDGKWEVRVILGESEEIDTFEIAAVVVDELTNARLKRWVVDAPRKNYPPIDFPHLFEGCSFKTVSVKVEKVGD